MAEHRDREGHRASAKEKICPSVTDKEQTAVTTSPWDLSRADGNCCRTALPCRDQPCRVPRGCSQPCPKGHARPLGHRAWAGGSQPASASGLSPGPHWPGCQGEAKEKLVTSALFLPSEEQEKPQGITLGGEGGPRDTQGLWHLTRGQHHSLKAGGQRHWDRVARR